MADTCVPEDAALPPKTAGFRGRASYARSYTFREAYEAADAVCIVSIRDHLGLDGRSCRSRAMIGKAYKGALPEAFTVVQYLGRRPRPFRYGDKLLLFLKKCAHGEDTDEYEVLGANICQLYAAAAEDGSVYLIDLSGLLSLESFERDMANCPPNRSELTVDGLPDPRGAEQTEQGRALLRELKKYVAKTDPAAARDPMCYVYRLEDAEALFDRFGSL